MRGIFVKRTNVRPDMRGLRPYQSTPEAFWYRPKLIREWFHRQILEVWDAVGRPMQRQGTILDLWEKHFPDQSIHDFNVEYRRKNGVVLTVFRLSMPVKTGDVMIVKKK